MKRVLSISGVLIFVCSMCSSNGLAYQIVVTETSAYEIVNGKEVTGGASAEVIYEVDEEQNIVTEVDVKTQGLPEMKPYEPSPIYEVVGRREGDLVATRVWETIVGTGEALMTFRSDGTYYHFQTLYLTVASENPNTFTTISYGKYRK